MTEHIASFSMVPVLSPLELQSLLLGQMLLHRVVRPLDQHIVKPCSLEDVSCGWGHAERVNGPPTVRLVSIQIDIAPFMA